jgi:Oxidoreductase molybdopterin binding domain
MSQATLDRVLAVLVIAMAATGLLSLRAGAPDTAWVFTVHAVLGGSLLAATVLKLRRSVPRAARAGRWRRLALGLLVSFLVVAALTGGFLWVASGELLSIGTWTVLTLHAWVGLLVVPLVVVHLLPRRWRVLRPPPRNGVSRRTVVATAGLGLVGIGAFGLASLADVLRGGVRRFTGSRWLPTGGIPPVTTFFGEGTPSIDPEAWRLTVTTPTSTRTWTLGALRALGETEIAAVLDCTSGWAIETGWRGVPLTLLLDASEPAPPTTRRRVLVKSVTGWSSELSIEDARGAFLATGVGGVDLPAGNGAPCRLVVPDRRGLDWVKWVTEVRVT